MKATVTTIKETNGYEPRRWRLRIRDVELTRGRVLQVAAEWHAPGPEPEPGQPDPREYASDYYDASTLELAQHVFGLAESYLRAGDDPDLRLIAQLVKNTHPELASDRRDAEGAAVLGDTAPDERPRR